MESVFSQEFTVSQIHADRFGRARPAALLYFIQEAAGSHCRLLGADRDALADKHLFWAVTRTKVEVTRLPKQGEVINVETWPMPTTRVAYPRAAVAKDENGNELFRSVSLWVLMDENTRAMVLPGVSGVEVNGTLFGSELSVPRAIPQTPLANTETRKVGYSLLDCNGHMNNTRYLDWVDDLQSSEFHSKNPIKAFTVCYLNEAREGDTVVLDFSLSQNGILSVNACRQEEDAATRIFSVQAEYESCSVN